MLLSRRGYGQRGDIRYLRHPTDSSQLTPSLSWSSESAVKVGNCTCTIAQKRTDWLARAVATSLRREEPLPLADLLAEVPMELQRGSPQKRQSRQN